MLHLILDTETTTLPGARALANGDSQKERNISTNLPIVYDIGWTVIDDDGNEIEKYDFLVKEIFTEAGRKEAYYGDKWPEYLEDVRKGKIIILPWENIMYFLSLSREKCENIGAYNARFDFHKAIPYTDQYIANMNNAEWLEGEMAKAIEYMDNPPDHKEADENCFYHLTEPTIWEFRNMNTPAVDIWNMACKTFLDTPQYKAWSIKNGMYTASAVYFSTNAENCYRFLLGDNGWTEDHTALSDARIESKIFTEIVKRYGQTACITIMPCMKLGRTVDFVNDNRFYFSKEDLNNLRSALNTYFTTKCSTKGSWTSQVRNLLTKLDDIRKDYEIMKNFAVTVRYMNYKTGAGLNRMINITLDNTLDEEAMDEALTDAIAIATEKQWMDMDFDSVIEVKELS